MACVPRTWTGHLDLPVRDRRRVSRFRVHFKVFDLKHDSCLVCRQYDYILRRAISASRPSRSLCASIAPWNREKRGPELVWRSSIEEPDDAIVKISVSPQAPCPISMHPSLMYAHVLRCIDFLTLNAMALIVLIKLSGLCGSDLHAYRGVAPFENAYVCLKF